MTPSVVVRRAAARQAAAPDLARPKFGAVRLRHCLLLIGLAAAGTVYLWGVPGNPPGFYLDESSIAYNAFTIARSGRDEHGEPWPLYFRSFGEYKNPPYVYLLAGLYCLFGPSILIARLFSAVLGLLAAALLGVLASRLTGRRGVGLLVAVGAAFTPWLFEISRLVYEVALFPLVLGAFLLILHHAQTDRSWSPRHSIGMGLALGLLTYTYSIGRLLGPLLALGLILFADRRRRAGVLQAWCTYALTLVPLLVFSWQNSGALSARFGTLSYITPESAPADLAWSFLAHYLGNLSLRNLLISGDPITRHHVPGAGSLLVAGFVLSVVGLALVLCCRRGDPWWRFILYGLAVSAVPASLTNEPHHTLRLVAIPIFLLVLATPALAWLQGCGAHRIARQTALAGLLGLFVLQAAYFQWQFQRSGSGRGRDFDADYLYVFERALATSIRPVYLVDKPLDHSYIHGRWYGVVRGLDTSELVRLESGASPPPGSLAVGTVEPCSGCQVVARRRIGRGEDFSAFVVR